MMMYVRLVWRLGYYNLVKSTPLYSPLLTWFVVLVGLVTIWYGWWFELGSRHENLDDLTNGVGVNSADVTMVLETTQESEIVLNQEVELVNNLIGRFRFTRDGWLYLGWLGLALNRDELVEESRRQLLLLDPNHPMVVGFMEKSAE